LIYFINIKKVKRNKFDVEVEMTLTSPNCPVAESLPEEVRTKVENLESVNKSTVTITFEPPWDSSFMSEEAKLELGML
jgi:metal-sulfur cluster biosynthetic enzyme